VERACRDDQAEGNSHSEHAEQLGQLYLGRPAARHAQTIRSHRGATDDVRVLYLVQRQPQRQEARLHAQDARCPAQHPSKSSEKHMRRLQSDIKGRARRRDISPSYRATDLEAQRGRHHPAVVVQSHREDCMLRATRTSTSSHRQELQGTQNPLAESLRGIEEQAGARSRHARAHSPVHHTSMAARATHLHRQRRRQGPRTP
jgi:hypothetical protein